MMVPEKQAVSEFTTGESMGQCCEKINAMFKVTRQEQDEFAVRYVRLDIERKNLLLYDCEDLTRWATKLRKAVCYRTLLQSDRPGEMWFPWIMEFG